MPGVTSLFLCTAFLAWQDSKKKKTKQQNDHHLSAVQSEIEFGPNDCVQSEEAERAVSEEEMEAAAFTWSKGVPAGPAPQDRQHPV